MKPFRRHPSKRQKRAERIRTGHGRRYTLAARRRARRRPFPLLAVVRLLAASIDGLARIGAIAASHMASSSTSNRRLRSDAQCSQSLRWISSSSCPGDQPA